MAPSSLCTQLWMMARCVRTQLMGGTVVLVLQPAHFGVWLLQLLLLLWWWWWCGCCDRARDLSALRWFLQLVAIESKLTDMLKEVGTGGAPTDIRKGKLVACECCVSHHAPIWRTLVLYHACESSQACTMTATATSGSVRVWTVVCVMKRRVWT